MSKDLALPDDYAKVLALLKERVRSARLSAQQAVNTELLRLYWTIGKAIVDRQQTAGWGGKVIEQLAGDLRAEFPEMTGLSRRNLHDMRSFAEAWPEIVQQPVAQLPWGHVTVLLDKLDDPSARDWYAAETVRNGWTRAVLLNQIMNQTHSRVGAAPSNFPAVLPAPDSALAQQIAKDPYVFDFLDLSDEVSERELEDALVGRLRQTLGEFGHGMAFVGRQVHFDVDGDDFYLDLLFFHPAQVRYVVVELKVEKFRPDHLGQLGFYVALVEDQLRDPNLHAPTVGLLLCAGRNERVVRYALGGAAQPLAVSDYTYESLPAEVREALPTAAEVLAAVEEPVDHQGRQLTIDEYLERLEHRPDDATSQVRARPDPRSVPASARSRW